MLSESNQRLDFVLPRLKELLKRKSLDQFVMLLDQARIDVDKLRDPPRKALFLYYSGLGNALQLRYREAAECLSQCVRCNIPADYAPQVPAFKLLALKTLAVVTLLTGSTPNKQSLKAHPSMYPYYLAAKAVRVGDGAAFRKVLDAYDANVFAKDGLSSMIKRLFHSVVNNALSVICRTHCAMNVEEVQSRLGIGSVQDTVDVVSAAIAGGVILASLERSAKGGMVLVSKPERESAALEDLKSRIEIVTAMRREVIASIEYSKRGAGAAVKAKSGDAGKDDASENGKKGGKGDGSDSGNNSPMDQFTNDGDFDGNMF